MNSSEINAKIRSTQSQLNTYNSNLQKLYQKLEEQKNDFNKLVKLCKSFDEEMYRRNNRLNKIKDASKYQKTARKYVDKMGDVLNGGSRRRANSKLNGVVETMKRGIRETELEIEEIKRQIALCQNTISHLKCR